MPRSASLTPPPSVQDSLYSWSRPMSSHRQPHQGQGNASSSSDHFDPSSSWRSRSRVPSAETAATVWSEDGAETVLPPLMDHEGRKGMAEVGLDEQEEIETDGGDLIQLYSDGEKQKQKRSGRPPAAQRKAPDGRHRAEVDESLLDSQQEFSGLREEDLQPASDGGYGTDGESEDDRSEAGVAPPAPTPGDKLRQLLAQMQAQTNLASTTARAASPIKALSAFPGQAEQRKSNGSADQRIPDGWRRPSGHGQSAGLSGSGSGHGASAHGGNSYNHAYAYGRSAEAGPSSPPLNVRKANWREGRRIGVVPPQSPPRVKRSLNEGHDGEDQDEEEDSPPTPPMRITNPFAMSARRREQEAAAAAEAEARENEQRSRSPQHLKRSLNQYISHHPTVPPPLPNTNLVTSQSSIHSSSTTSRKGKERAHGHGSTTSRTRDTYDSESDADDRHLHSRSSDLPVQAAGRSARTPRVGRTGKHVYDPSAPSNPEQGRTPRPPTAPNAGRRSAPTPRRSSVDLAPDDSALFAQEADGLEVPGGMLDLDEDVSGRGVMWEHGDDDDAGSEHGGRVGGEGSGTRYEDAEDRTDGSNGRDSRISMGYQNRSGESTLEGGRDISRRSDSARLGRLPGQSQSGHIATTDDGDDDSGAAESAHRAQEDTGRGESTHRVEALPPVQQRPITPVSQQHTSAFAGHTPSPIRVGMVTVASPSRTFAAQEAVPGPARPPSQSGEDKGRIGTRTPVRSSTRLSGGAIASANISNMATPHPPGWLPNTPVPGTKKTAMAAIQSSPARAVRFSPLRRNDADWSATNSSVRTGTTGDVGERSTEPAGLAEDLREESSLHRIQVRVSPRSKRSTRHSASPSTGRNSGDSPLNRSPGGRSSPLRYGTAPALESDEHVRLSDRYRTLDGNTSIDPDSSFTARLLAPLTKLLPVPLPGRSKTYAAAVPLIRSAEEETVKARDKVQESQKVWLDAIAALQRLEGRARSAVETVQLDAEVVRDVVVGGARWGAWAWWVAMEILLMWAVFRITIEYASPSMLNHLQTPDLSFFTSRSSSSSSARQFPLSVPLPHGLSAFVVRQSRSSVNFFDLLEKADFWLTGLAQSRMEGVSKGWEGGWGGGGVPS